MIDLEQTQLLIYAHVVQLTLLDHEIDSAFELAYAVAAEAFHEAFTQRGLAAAFSRRASAAQGRSPTKDNLAEAGAGKKA